MALHFPLMVNGEQIGYFEAVRVSGTTNSNSINCYRIRILRKDEPVIQYYIEHRYGDGAWVLIREAFNEERRLAGELDADRAPFDPYDAVRVRGIFGGEA